VAARLGPVLAGGVQVARERLPLRQVLGPVALTQWQELRLSAA